MKSPTHGFTLIELTIVLALIGLLLTIAVPRYFHAVDHGKLAVQRQNLAAMRDAIDKYYGDLGRYPDELDDLVRKKYLRSIPVDPITEKADWTVVAPEDPTQGKVFDVVSVTAPADAAKAASAASKPASDDTPRAPAGTQKAANAH